MKGFSIRPGTATDAQRISAFVTGLAQDYIIGEFSPAGRAAFSNDHTTEKVRERLVGDFRFYLAEKGGELAGVAAIRSNSHLYYLFVGTPFQRAGLARHLWREVRKEAIALGNSGTFTVNASNHAVPAYEKLGFRRTGPTRETNGVLYNPMEALSVRGVDIHVEGEGAESIVMVHGWPDTYRLWDATVAALKDRYRCIRFTLPGFDPRSDGRTHTLDELLGFLHEVVERTSQGKKVTLLLHDWGCFFGYQFYARHPEKVSRIVGVDIGDPRSTAKTMTGREKAIMLSYQTWNAMAWRIGGGIGNWMIRAMANLAECPSDRTPMSWRMGYPYYVLWFGGRDSFRGQVRRFEPKCPMLFVYGRRKPLRFHSPQWAAELKEKPGNDVIEFDTGHWVMSNAPERFNRVVGEWLARA